MGVAYWSTHSPYLQEVRAMPFGKKEEINSMFKAHDVELTHLTLILPEAALTTPEISMVDPPHIKVPGSQMHFVSLHDHSEEVMLPKQIS